MMTHKRIFKKPWRRVGNSQSGIILVALLAYMAVAITLTMAAVGVTIVNSQTSSKYTLGKEAMANAESGAEDALIRILRDPNLTVTNEVVTLPSGTVTITISGGSTKTIVAEGASGSFKRRVQATATVSSTGIVTLTSWTEL